jgi:hypothetical protein
MDMTGTTVADSAPPGGGEGSAGPGEAGSGGVDFSSVLDDQPSIEGESGPDPGSEPDVAGALAEPTEPAPGEGVDRSKAAPESTADEYPDPLPEKLEGLLQAVRAKNPELARSIRDDHFALNGSDGYRAVFPQISEAREYRMIAPTLQDLQGMQEFATRYTNLDQLYVGRPAELLQVLAEDRPSFVNVMKALEPGLRADPEAYQMVSQAFGTNLFHNLIAQVEKDGLGEDVVEVLRGVAQRYLGARQGSEARADAPRLQPREQRELEQLRRERDSGRESGYRSFFTSVNDTYSSALLGEAKKYVDERTGKAFPDDVRDEIAEYLVLSISKEINGNSMAAGELSQMIRSGRLDSEHAKQVLERVMVRARAYLPTKAAPLIRKWSDRLRRISGGSNPKTAAASKDVGSGAPSAPAPSSSASTPAGAPPGWATMSVAEQSKWIDFDAMDKKYGNADEALVKRLPIIFKKKRN